MTPLRQRMLDALVLRGMALRTQEAYIGAVAGLARHYARSPDTLSADEVQHYLLHLLRERKLSRSSVNQYGCAYRFFYATVLGLDGDAFQIPLGAAPQRLVAHAGHSLRAPGSAQRQSDAPIAACATTSRRLRHRRAASAPPRRSIQRTPALPAAAAETYTAHSTAGPGGSVQRGLSDTMHLRAFNPAWSWRRINAVR